MWVFLLEPDARVPQSRNMASGKSKKDVRQDVDVIKRI